MLGTQLALLEQLPQPRSPGSVLLVPEKGNSTLQVGYHCPSHCSSTRSLFSGRLLNRRVNI